MKLAIYSTQWQKTPLPKKDWKVQFSGEILLFRYCYTLSLLFICDVYTWITEKPDVRRLSARKWMMGNHLWYARYNLIDCQIVLPLLPGRSPTETNIHGTPKVVVSRCSAFSHGGIFRFHGSFLRASWLEEYPESLHIEETKIHCEIRGGWVWLKFLGVPQKWPLTSLDMTWYDIIWPSCGHCLAPQMLSHQEASFDLHS